MDMKQNYKHPYDSTICLPELCPLSLYSGFVGL